MNNFWNERFAGKEYAYGILPNVFLKEQLDKLPAGKILFVCEGEGRNAVYAAKNNWIVEAFDLSEEGKKKALQLAAENHVSINYQIADATEAEYPLASFDAVALIYAHFPASIRKTLHKKFMSLLKPGGVLILEAFSPLQLNNNSGGPKELSMLYSKEILEDDFKGLTVKTLRSDNILLNEGKYHHGIADVIRFAGQKK